jgi:phosphate acetyltransferase
MPERPLTERIKELDDDTQFECLLESLIVESQQHLPISVAVCWPCSQILLMGALAETLRAIGVEAEAHLDPGMVIDAKTEEDAVAKAVELCRSGHAAALMKGSLHTDVLLRAALRKEDGLRTSRRTSHVFIMEAPLYRRALFITDAAVNIDPTLEDKVDIVQNAIDLAHVLGNSEPKVAILSAVETVNPRIASTVDAAALCKMAERGQITGAILDGPLAFDAAVSAEAARVKGLKSPVAGAADILVVPDLESGNMLAKELGYLGAARSAGIVLGTKVPIILTSRADSIESRVASCAVASVVAHSQSN